jgi:hypothetical protein
VLLAAAMAGGCIKATSTVEKTEQSTTTDVGKVNEDGKQAASDGDGMRKSPRIGHAPANTAITRARVTGKSTNTRRPGAGGHARSLRPCRSAGLSAAARAVTPAGPVSDKRMPRNVRKLDRRVQAA